MLHAGSWMKAPYITFSTALLLLGLSAAFGGPWVERNGPRRTAVLSAIFFCSGLSIGGVGLSIGSAWVVFLGMGLVCGIGCGLGYIAPVSTLVKWFPDRRGMATGFAVMGFGGGAFVAGKLNVFLMDWLGIVNGLFLLAGAYLALMLAGAWIIRRPPAGWKPEGWTPKASADQREPEASDFGEATNAGVTWCVAPKLITTTVEGSGTASKLTVPISPFVSVTVSPSIKPVKPLAQRGCRSAR
jgi:MFS family permease